MRKQAIIWLGLAMVLTFLGLVFIQFSYFNTLITMRHTQFDRGVKQGLYQTCRILEEEEALSYINKALQKEGKNQFDNWSVGTTQIQVSTSLKSHAIVVPSANVAHDLHNKMKQKYVR
jgi:two-component system phosphate regulon sensor histidine kinase PhoR